MLEQQVVALMTTVRYESMSQKVFVSYGREDKETALRIRRDLEALGIGTWIDEVDLLGGQNWRVEIYQALKAASVILVLLSQATARRRGFVHAEVRTSLDIERELPEGQVLVIPVRLDDCHPANSALADLQWIDLFPDYGSGFQRLAESVRRALDEGVLGVGKATAPMELSPEPGNSIEENEDVSPLMRCEVCREYIRTGARRCRHCLAAIAYRSNQWRFLRGASAAVIPLAILLAVLAIRAFGLDSGGMLPSNFLRIWILSLLGAFAIVFAFSLPFSRKKQPRFTEGTNHERV